MRQEFVEVRTIEAAQTACPWAAEIVEVEGGFQAFESMTDYNNWIKNTDQETEEESEEVPSVEVCSDVEWVRENEIWHREGIDESDLDDAARTYNEAVYKALTDKGWDVWWAKGQRMFFHGWNGAHFTTQCGCVGSWAKLTEEQIAVIDEARKLADKTVMDTWGKPAGETRQDVVEAVEAANLCCPVDVCDAVLGVWESGGDWRAELAEAVKNDAVVAKQIGLE